MKRFRYLIFLVFYFIVINADEKGVYFPIKQYTPSIIPSFEKIKNKIPQPILTQDKGFIDLYYFTWELAWKHIKKPPKNSPFVSDFIDEAFNANIFQWDTHFMILFWRYIYYIFPAINSHNNFYRTQAEDGYICREIQEKDGNYFFYEGKENTINPPLFPWVEFEYFKFSDDTSRFSIIYESLKKYGEWLDKNRVSRINKNLYWQTNLGSGMDNSPRFGAAWIDMSSQMVLYYEYLEKIARMLKKEKDAEYFAQKYKDIAFEINKLMWDDSAGLYFDLDGKNQKTFVPTIASFWPLLAGIADKKQADKLVMNLKDTAQFFRKIPVATLSAKHKFYSSKGNYWRGSVWASTNYMVIRGLRNYHFEDFLYQLSYRYLKGVYEVFKKTHTLWENYSPDYYSPGDIAKPDFVGWTGLVPISILIENILGIEVNAPENTITWFINRKDKHGIKNLYFGGNCVSLIANERQLEDEIPVIEVKTRSPFWLIIKVKDYSKKYFIQKDTIIVN